MNTTPLDNLSTEPIVILGSKKNPALPAVAAQTVITANNAVELGVLYREKYGSRIIAMASSRVLRDELGVQESFRRSRPDEVVLLGEDIDDPVSFVRDRLGLMETVVTIVKTPERNRLITDAVGWRKYMLAAHILALRGIKHAFTYALPDALGKRNRSWLNRSTGLNAILYGLKRFPRASEVISAGINLQAGQHFSGSGKFLPKDALADRIMVNYWPPQRRPRLSTTDEEMGELGQVPVWKGGVFHLTP